MASSRIYVKGLPRNITEAEFKKHFSEDGQHVTDAKVIPRRGIGFVGYSTPEDAQKAIKYFNRTFIRMSRLHVELATPPQDSKSFKKSESEHSVNASSGASRQKHEGRGVKRKRHSESAEENDPKLKEFLELSRSKHAKNARQENAADAAPLQDDGDTVAITEGQSDDEYEEIPRKTKRTQESIELSGVANAVAQHDTIISTSNAEAEADIVQTAVSDADWARLRTSRLLGLLDEDEEEVAETFGDGDAQLLAGDDNLRKGSSKKATIPDQPHSIPTPPSDEADQGMPYSAVSSDVEKVRSTMRLLVRNLLHTVKAEDLEVEFGPHGNLEEVHVVLDKGTRTSKGFAFLQFSDADSAEAAWREKDGQTLQGRLMHVLPSEAKRETMLNEFTLSKLPWKKQQEIKTRREAASKRFNWNSLYMNSDAVMSSVATRLGLPKSEVLDPTSSDAAVKQALAETHIIQETQAYFEQHGIDLEAFKTKRKGDTAILIKNIPYDSEDELKRRFEEYGEVKQFLVPPSGTVAIVEFVTAAQGEAAFSALNHRRFKTTLLLLEKAPKDLFNGNTKSKSAVSGDAGAAKSSIDELKTSDDTIQESSGRATLFVGNLNFDTTSQRLVETFKPTAGFLSAVVRTRTDPKKPGDVLSNGYGFLEFRTSQQALAAMQAMNGFKLDNHKIELKVSRKGVDAAEARRAADSERKAAGTRTKIMIRNLAFEATKKDISNLFGSFGQLRSVRAPKKMDRSLRGFGFADFTTPKEAQNAMDALKHTHLLGRKLVLEFADEEPEDAEAEIEKMQQKVGAQVNKVALRKLTSGGRKKFSTQTEEDA